MQLNLLEDEMGTKNNPGKYDCYSAAEPDEPMFVLLGRDRLAGHLVSIWSKIRVGDYEAAEVVFGNMVNKHCSYYIAQPDVEKSMEALECAMAMFRWRAKKEEEVK